jgi:hypothetical protein
MNKYPACLLSFTLRRKLFQFQKRYSSYREMDKVHKPSDSERYAPLQEQFTFHSTFLVFLPMLIIPNMKVVSK